MRDAAVERRTGGKAIVQAKNLVGVGGLQCRAERVRGGKGAVVFANNRRRGEGARRQLLTIQAVGRRAIPVAKYGRVISTWSYVIRTRISVRRVLAEGAVVGIGVDRPGRRHVKPAGQVQIANLVGVCLRRRVVRVPGRLQQFGRRGAGGAIVVARRTDIEVNLAVHVAVADIAIEAQDVRFREQPVTIVVDGFEGAVDRPFIDLLAPLQRGLCATIGAAHHVDLGTVIVEAVLHLDVQRAAERIEAVSRIVGDQRDRANRRGRDQVPVHGVAERFVDTNTVLVDREPLWRTGYRRGHVTAEIHVWRELVAPDGADAHAGNILLQRVRDVKRIGACDLTCIDGGNGAGHLVGVEGFFR